MSRYRPPSPRSSAYITRSGYERLLAESAQLWQRRKGVTEALSAAAAEGDRSENAEYIYRKKELGGIDRRIRYLQKRLPQLTVVDAASHRRDACEQVFFGAEVDLETASGDILTIRLVGADEIDPSAGCISIDSPLGAALLKRRVDDEVWVRTGEQRKCYVVLAVRYVQDN